MKMDYLTKIEPLPKPSMIKKEHKEKVLRFIQNLDKVSN